MKPPSPAQVMSENIWPDRIWTNKREKIFVNLVIEEMNKMFGKYPESFSFSEESWGHICQQFNEVQNVRFDVTELKTRFSGLKKRYEIVIPLYDGDYGWNGTRRKIFIYDSDWELMIDDTPEIEPYRKHGCPLFAELSSIFESYRSTWEYGSCEGEVDTQPSRDTNTAPGTSTKCLQSEAPSSGPNKLPYQAMSKEIWPDQVWTNKWEEIFVNLVIEEKNKMFGTFPVSFSFSEESWENIRQRFTDLQNLSFDVAELKRRFAGLKKRYEIVEPLYEGDYGWDGTRRMIFIYDSDWELMIEDTPEVEPYQKHGCPLYVELASIFGSYRSTWGYGGCVGEVGTQPSSGRNIAPGIREKRFHSETPSPVSNKPPSQTISEEIWPDKIWTNKREKMFAESVIVHMHVSHTIPNNFSEESWETIRQWLNESPKVSFDVAELKWRLAVLKKRYEIVAPLYDSGEGYGWDDKKQMFDMFDFQWTKVIKVTPELKPYRKHGCPLYHQLEYIFSTNKYIGRVTLGEGKIGIQHSSGKVALDISKKRIQSEAPSSGPNKKYCAEVGKVASQRVAQSAAPQTFDLHSAGCCISVINEMKGIDRQLYTEAIDLFKNQWWRKTFISLKQDKRLNWLKAMLPKT